MHSEFINDIFRCERSAPEPSRRALLSYLASGYRKTGYQPSSTLFISCPYQIRTAAVINFAGEKEGGNQMKSKQTRRTEENNALHKGGGGGCLIV
jgi:hypothetical protein